MPYQEDVVNCFQAALKTFKMLQEWYSDVKSNAANPHSLACVLGLTNKQLICFIRCGSNRFAIRSYQ